MKIDFPILWVDDNVEFAESIQQKLERWLTPKGFELQVIIHANENGVLEDVKSKDIELIIIDYKLPKKKGDEIIKEIRDAECYQDIIFYSQGDLPEETFDGVFHVSKEDANTRIRELIELKIKRSNDPASVRGWIVADTIELEIMLNDILSQCFLEKEDFSFTSRLLSDEDNFLDFGKKYILLNSLVKDLIVELDKKTTKDPKRIGELRSSKTILDLFMKEIIHIRNAIAHQRVEISSGGKIIKAKIKSGNPITLNEETFAEIRKNIRKHRDNLITLRSLV
jgi:CheY-like chemotaxis protein